MQKTLTYKTSYFDDSYALRKQNTFFGKLYKTAWLGSTIDIKIGDKQYRIERNGILYPTILITDKSNHQKIGEVNVSYPLFGLYPKATAIFENGKKFQWKIKGFWNRSWAWTEQGNTLITTREENKLFSKQGEICLSSFNMETELLSVLGLYLRSSISRQNAVGISIGLTFIVISLFRLLS